MSLLSYNRLVELIKEGVIDAPIEAVNASSIDITLGRIIHAELVCPTDTVVDIEAGGSPKMGKRNISEEGHVMVPGSFILGSSIETFNLPKNISAEYKLNSSLARVALDHLNAGWCDAGWNGSVLTLELVNCLRFHNLLLKAGMKIGQIVFFEHEEVPEEASYATKGQYNQDRESMPSKGLRSVGKVV